MTTELTTPRRSTRRLAAAVLATVAFLATMLAAPPASAREPLVVDDDRQQCASAAFTSVGEALEQAVDGDLIQVCPGTYREQLRVTKSVRIIGSADAVGRLDCFAESPSVLDTTQVAVLEPPDPSNTDAIEPLMTLDADNVELAGLVLHNVVDETEDRDASGLYPFYIPAVATTDAYSGYRVHHNAFLSNTLAVEFGSSGATRSSVEGNCLRDNDWAVANQRFELRNAVVGSNATFRTHVIAYEIGWGYRTAASVTVRGNVSRLDAITMLFENTMASRVTGNTITSASVTGIGVAGGNTDIRITDNNIAGPGPSTGVPVGIRFTSPGSTVPARSSGVEVRGNTISGLKTTNAVGTVFGVGVSLGVNALNGATFTGNTMFDNAQSGLVISNGNTNNVVRGTRSDNNGTYGIRVAANTSGNLFQGNHMYGNTIADAIDETDPNVADGIQLRNRWLGNDCATDLPAGAICG